PTLALVSSYIFDSQSQQVMAEEVSDKRLHWTHPHVRTGRLTPRHSGNIRSSSVSLLTNHGVYGKFLDVYLSSYQPAISRVWAAASHICIRMSKCLGLCSVVRSRIILCIFGYTPSVLQ